MFVLLVFYLHSLLSPALGQTIPEADHPSFIPDSEGDLFFLLDSSGSVTYDEFSKVKKFIGDLLQPFKFGPQDVQASVVQISTNPTLEFPLNQYSSSKDVQNAIQKIRQRMGDTNTGKAIDYVKKNLYAEDFGSRSDVPKVLVWVTDGLSTDDISLPMKLLKDMGVSVFIISTTGRGNFQELSAAASEPNEKFLKFVDKDDLGIITKELRDSIIELIKAKRLHALNITTTSFLLTWPKLLSKEIGHYVLKYAPIADTKKIQLTLQGDQTSLEITDLTANTTYEVTLYPESNVEYFQPQTIKVSTLQEVKEERNLEVMDITTTGFVLSWTRLTGDTGIYVLEFSPLSDPKSKLQITTSVEETSVVLSSLTPNTTYQVTLLPDSNDSNIQPETIQVSTLPDYIQARNLQILGITSTSFNASWSRLNGDMGRYFLDYSLLTYPRRKTRKTLYGDQTSAMVSGLIPNTTYLVTFIPESKLEASQSQTLPVSTLPDHTQTRNLQARDITSTGFLLTWTRLPGDEGRYVLEYMPVSDPGMTQQKIVHGDETSVAVSGLKSGTTYQITLTPEHSAKYAPPEVITVSTQSEQILPRNFQIINVTATSFLLTWSRAPGDWGRYMVEYSPVSDPSRTLQKTLSGDDNSTLISNLSPNTTYQVSLTHESGVQYGRIRVSTLIDLIRARNLHVRDRTSNSFQVSWTKLPGDTGRYVLEYAPLKDLSKAIKNILYGDQTSVTFSNLAPDTVYQVTFIPDSKEQFNQVQNIRVSTLPELDQKRLVYARDITTASLQLGWSRMPGDKGPYIVEFILESDPRRKLTKTLPFDETNIIFSNLSPNTEYRAVVFSESNIQHVPPQSIHMSTLDEQLSPAHILISDPSAHSFRVSWGPSLDSVAGYEIQYGPMGSNIVRTLQVDSKVNSTVLENLKPNTTYLVTVSAIFKSGGEKALSALACTEHNDTKVKFLHFQDLGSNSLKATWGSADGEVQGYRVRCRRQAGRSSVTSVAPQTHSVYLTDMAEGAINKICVVPIYKNGEGKNLCRKIQLRPRTSADSYSRTSTR